MASWTTLIWNETSYMFEHGTQHCHINHSSLFINCGRLKNKIVGLKSIAKNPGRSYPLITGGWKDTDVSMIRMKRGTYLYPGETMQSFIDDQVERLAKQKKNNKMLPSLICSTKTPYASTGWYGLFLFIYIPRIVFSCDL